MPVFAVQYSYVDRPDEVTEHRPAHRDFLRALLEQGTVLAAGAYTDQPAGALLIFSGESVQEISRLLESDPFQQLGLVEHVDIRAWGQAMGPWA